MRWRVPPRHPPHRQDPVPRLEIAAHDVEGLAFPWADLLLRVFLVDVLCCTRCGGRRRVLEAVTDPGAAARILLHLGLEATAPRAEPARAPPDHLGIAS